uniref:Uncharacterized protein n=1 Tax=viral metagenome TaxID=1070528 RepID=A0A6C0B5X7_9ZZZZ
MALDNQQLTMALTYISIFLVFQFIMTFHFYFQLRNKRGPPGPKGERGRAGHSRT